MVRNDSRKLISFPLSSSLAVAALMAINIWPFRLYGYEMRNQPLCNVCKDIHQAQVQQGSEMNADAIKERGEKLREEINKTYGDLSNSHTLKPQNYITDLVLRYIPVGITFSEAEAVLSAADIKTHIIDNQILSGKADLSTAMGAKVEVYIDISPQIPGDFKGETGKVEALIAYSTL